MAGGHKNHLVMKFEKYLLAAMVACLCISCGSNREIADVSEGSVTGYSLSIFRNLLATVSSDDNVTISPYSAGVALSMLAEGADGQTLAELDKALASCRFKKSDIEEAGSEAEDAVIVRSANSLWTNSSYPVKAAYSELLSREYGATSQALDFSLNSSKDAINAWAREHTEGKIDNVVNELSPQMVAILANALYFKGAWHRPFDVHMTAERTFHGTRGDRAVDFMSAEEFYEYAEYYGNQMVRIPYIGGRYAMTIFLPSEDMGLSGVESYMDEAVFDQAMEKLSYQKIKLSLPKFRVEGDFSLIQTLQRMGVHEAFGSGAELSGIADGPLTVSEVNQKTYVNVDEAGSEAAAVTTIGVRLTAMRPVEQVPVMNVDRPFYYMISDTESGIIFFIGRISNL